jgi:hypothetical protein
MTRPSYLRAIDRVLEPIGFARRGRDWVRVRGDIEERVDLQKSGIDGGVTLNVWAKDLQTERILRSIPCHTVLGIRQVGVRIGALMDGYDRWWRNDPEGPAELAEAVQLYVVPWFDRVRTLEDQASNWYGRGTQQPWRKPNLAALVVTLVRLGCVEEALALFEAPVPKTAIPALVAEGRCVQLWLKSQLCGLDAHGP